MNHTPTGLPKKRWAVRRPWWTGLHSPRSALVYLAPQLACEKVATSTMQHRSLSEPSNGLLTLTPASSTVAFTRQAKQLDFRTLPNKGKLSAKTAYESQSWFQAAHLLHPTLESQSINLSTLAWLRCAIMVRLALPAATRCSRMSPNS